MQSIELKILGKAKNNKDRIAIECYKHLQDLYKKEFSEIIHYFYGIYVNEIISIDGSVIHSLKPESFFILDLEMPSQSTKINLHDCLEQYIKEEKMMGENSWFNEKTLAREDIIKKISFWSFPKVLIFSLKRFINENHKSNTIIDFPINDLDLNIYIKGYNNNRKYIYDLYAICNHMGNNHNGHYFTFIKRENKWFCYDDSKITEIKESNIITPYVYCLFYRQKI
jgi:ubiquitin C-terminal hydrolase